jgi:hypothetical protein
MLTISRHVLYGCACRSGASRARIWLHASSTAAPLRSDEAEAAVGDALAVLSVAVSEMRTMWKGIWKACAQTWHILVKSP